jgi:hypothetical protein
MLTDTQIDDIDELATYEKTWHNTRYTALPLTPDTVRVLTIELKGQRRMIAAVRAA